jgi:hypothetical protein
LIFVIARKSPNVHWSPVDLASGNGKCQISNAKWKMKFPIKLFPHRLLLKRDEGIVVLVLALPGQEVVITASILFGEGATRFGAMFVDGAVPLGRVQKPASAFEDIIFTVSQNTVAVFLVEHGEFVLGLFITDLEALRQSRNVAFRDQYQIIRTTVSRTF